MPIWHNMVSAADQPRSLNNITTGISMYASSPAHPSGPLALVSIGVIGLALASPSAAADCGDPSAKFTVTLASIVCSDATDSMDADEVYVEVTHDGNKCTLGPYSLDTGDSTTPNVKVHFNQSSSWHAYEEDGGGYGDDDDIGTKSLTSADRDGMHDETWYPDAGQYKFMWFKVTNAVADTQAAPTEPSTTGGATQGDQGVGGLSRATGLGRDYGVGESKVDRVPASAAKCADEGGTCSFSGSRMIYYGVGDKWVRRLMVDGAACGASAFSDPAPGQAKSCFIGPGRR